MVTGAATTFNVNVRKAGGVTKLLAVIWNVNLPALRGGMPPDRSPVVGSIDSHRPYRPAMTLESAHQELRACAGTQFDPDIIHALLGETPSRPRAAATESPASPPPIDPQPARQSRST
jgi:hypothetical protein